MFENETNPVTEVEENSTPQEPEIQLDETENEEQDPQTTDSEEVVEELEDAEFEGKTYKLPKELKPALLRQSDYTKKTQEVAEMRKSIEAERQAFQKEAEARRTFQKEYAEVQNLDLKLKEYDDLFASNEWQEIQNTDMQKAFRIDQDYRALEKMRNAKAETVSRKEQEMSLNQQRELAKREEETRAVLSRDVKGWGSEMESNLTAYAKSQGFADPVISNVLKYDSVAAKTMHKAYLYDQLLKKQLSKPKVEVKPVGKVHPGSSKITKDPSKMTQDEYSRWRRERIAKNS